MLFRICTIFLLTATSCWAYSDVTISKRFLKIHECEYIETTPDIKVAQPFFDTEQKVWYVKKIHSLGHRIYKCNDGNEYSY